MSIKKQYISPRIVGVKTIEDYNDEQMKMYRRISYISHRSKKFTDEEKINKDQKEIKKLKHKLKQSLLHDLFSKRNQSISVEEKPSIPVKIEEPSIPVKEEEPSISVKEEKPNELFYKNNFKELIDTKVISEIDRKINVSIYNHRYRNKIKSQSLEKENFINNAIRNYVSSAKNNISTHEKTGHNWKDSVKELIFGVSIGIILGILYSKSIK